MQIEPGPFVKLENLLFWCCTECPILNLDINPDFNHLPDFILLICAGITLPEDRSINDKNRNISLVSKQETELTLHCDCSFTSQLHISVIELSL